MQPAPAWIALGKLVRTHGIRGELRCLPYNPATTALRPGRKVGVCRDSTPVETTVVAVRRHARFLLLALEGIQSLEAAQSLVGSEVCVRPQDLEPAGPGEAYYFQLVGLETVTAAGQGVGRIESVFRTAAHDVCVVRRPDGRELLIPFVEPVIREVRLNECKLVIEPVPGMLEDEKGTPSAAARKPHRAHRYRKRSRERTRARSLPRATRD